MTGDFVGQVAAFVLVLWSCAWAGYEYCLCRHASERNRWAKYFRTQDWFLVLHCADCPNRPAETEPSDHPHQLPALRNEADAA